MTQRHRGLTAAAATLLLFAVAGAALFACGGSESAGPEVTSAPRPTASDDRDPGSGGRDVPDLSVPDLTVPEELADELGDTDDQLGDCSDVVLAYTQLAITVLEGDGAQEKVDEVLSKVRPKVPADLQDDLKVVGDTYARAAKAGIVNAPEVLDDPGFRKANKAIGDWLSTECGVDLGGN